MSGVKDIPHGPFRVLCGSLLLASSRSHWKADNLSKRPMKTVVSFITQEDDLLAREQVLTLSNLL